MSFVLLEWTRIMPVAKASRIAIRGAACSENDAQYEEPDDDGHLDAGQPELNVSSWRWIEALADVLRTVSI